MSHLLIPRLSTNAALARLNDVEGELRQGGEPSALVLVSSGTAIPNETGGRAATGPDLRRWRQDVIVAMDGVRPGSVKDNALHSMRLGQAITEVIDPSPSDAAHDGVWSFLALTLYPDILAARWPAVGETFELPKDRWIGRQTGRDRNYLKLAWRRWQVFGSVMTETGDPLGEDEFGALLERSAVARNARLVRLASREVISYSGGLARTDFARRLMRGLTAMTGPLQLDILSDQELCELVRATARRVEPAE